MNIGLDIRCTSGVTFDDPSLTEIKGDGGGGQSQSLTTYTLVRVLRAEIESQFKSPRSGMRWSDRSAGLNVSYFT